MNLSQLLIARAAERPDLRIGTVDRQLELSDALRRAAGGARALRDRGLRPGDRVAVVAPSSTDYLVVWMACLLAGTPVALVNPTYPEDLLATMLDHLDPAFVVTEVPDTVADWPDLEVEASPGLDADRFDIASFMHTSGTTGVPKFCAQTHSYFLRLGRAVADALGLTAADRMLAPLPLFHINPLGYGIVGALTAGADALTVDRFSARGFWPAVREHGVTALALHAPPVEILKRSTTAADAAGHRVRTMFYADAEFVSRFGIPLAVSGYGSTEAAGVSHLHRWRLGDDIPANASRYGGLPRSDVDDRVVDGQILVREREPGTLFAGYYAHGVLNSATDAEGWFATGDLGRRDSSHGAAGGLVFLERAAESIRVKGEFVPIPFVEERFGTLAQLTDLALWKTPGDLVDDDAVLYVVAEPVPVDAIRAVAATLPGFMRPARVAQVRAIPRDAAAGKVQRRLLDGQEVLSWTAL
ncbi:AMP-binding protein [Virgisporangium aurantiacum]|uniref:ATP-dependent acyl-CoA ligase n=1 Tax=Virgisporangium aurantiacum TaxID=175570 RepID=A0A8J3Z3Z7_9ACTN|nr:AMP-binding protein [Virgisporangium aurantiacum]GIJ56312.1 ATP-dependent acyl-CoA ligase [Virgisporangium aurantiacum]